ncbi:MAG: M1 family aminopeptidase [Fimbriimonas sp.]
MPLFLVASLVLHSALHLQGQGNPFTPPRAKVQYAPDRDVDLIDVLVTLDVDDQKYSFAGSTVNTVVPLRDGTTFVRLHAGPQIAIKAIKVNGQGTTFKQAGEDLTIQTPGLKRGVAAQIAISYASVPVGKIGAVNGNGGWYWLTPRWATPGRAGFWTQGESIFNRNWAVTWDYPNDFATSETVVTVRSDWTVVGNGALVSSFNSPDGKKRTWRWKMTQPHATYLISLVGGPFDVAKGAWRKKPLWFVVPQGKGGLIPDSFNDTGDILDFFSSVTGVEYPWPKLAQDAMYDFGGGMENVSAITYGQDALTDRREGFRNMSSLNAHEIAHQWFGDLVTCKDWGTIWLNESFATYFQAAYFEHSQGLGAYEREIEGFQQEYLREARSYKRPIVTNLYEHPDSMFDSHAYPKGGTVLHTLRRYLGDQAFYAGIKNYLTRNRHRPVTTSDLCEAMSDASGINLTSFFEQWVLKPGHPVLDYTWTYANGSVAVTSHQTQDTTTGTPIYTIPTKVAIIKDGKVTIKPFLINQKENTAVYASVGAPDAVILDPNHDFLRELKHTFDPAELRAIVQFAPSSIDRQAAGLALLTASDNPETAKFLADLLAKDSGLHPVFVADFGLGSKKRPELRSFFVSQLRHANFDRRFLAVRGLAQLDLTDADLTTFAALTGDTQPYAVARFALRTLADRSPEKARPVLARLIAGKSKDDVMQIDAFQQLVKLKATETYPALVRLASTADRSTRLQLFPLLGRIPADDSTRAALTSALRSDDQEATVQALRAVRTSKDIKLLELAARLTASPNTRIKSEAESTVKVLTTKEG